MYSDDEYRALGEGAGAVVRRDRGLLAVSGADRAAWLQGLLTNDVEALGPGQACYAAWLTPQGRMITDMRVMARDDRLVLDLPAAVTDAVRDRLEGLIFAEDARVADVSQPLSLVELHGPGAPAVIGRALLTATDDGAPGVARLDEYGRPGYVIVVERPHVPTLLARLVEHGAREVSLETLEIIRVESGVPAFLADMDETTIPLEAGIEHRAISFTKGCYVGQEIIVRVTHRGGGRVARRLVGLMASPGHVVVPGDRLYAGKREIGRVTSTAWSPALERNIALGFVHRDFVEPGTALEAQGGGERVQ